MEGLELEPDFVQFYQMKRHGIFDLDFRTVEQWREKLKQEKHFRRVAPSQKLETTFIFSLLMLKNKFLCSSITVKLLWAIYDSFHTYN